jgi:hypothetical protein
MSINWEGIAVALDSIQPSGTHGWIESGGAEIGRRALAHILTEHELENAVEWYLEFRPGCEVARSVLNLLSSDYVMDRCYEIARTDGSTVRRRSAVELLRGFATARTLPWVATFLADQDQDVQTWGASLLDQLVFRRAVEPEEAEPYIAAAEAHPNPSVKRTAALIRDFVLTSD